MSSELYLVQSGMDPSVYWQYKMSSFGSFQDIPNYGITINDSEFILFLDSLSNSSVYYQKNTDSLSAEITAGNSATISSLQTNDIIKFYDNSNGTDSDRIGDYTGFRVIINTPVDLYFKASGSFSFTWEYKLNSSGTYASLPNNSINIESSQVTLNKDASSSEFADFFYAINPTDPPSVTEITSGMPINLSLFSGDEIYFYQLSSSPYTRLGSNSNFKIVYQNGILFKYDFDSFDNGNDFITDKSNNDYHLTKKVVDHTDSNSGWSAGTNSGWKTNSQVQNPFNDSSINSFRFERSATPDSIKPYSRGVHFELLSTSFINHTGNFSISVWCKPEDSSMKKHESILSFNNSNTDNTFQIGMINDNSSEFRVVCASNSSKSFTIGSYTNYINGGSGSTGWTHIAITFDDSTSTLETYFNNTKTNTHNSSSSPSTTGFDFTMGNIKIGSNRNETHKFNGLVSLLRGYNFVLSSSDINGLYNGIEVCYHPNTIILTNQGYIKITDLKRGDLIKTLNGYKPLSKLLKNINIKTKFMEFPKNCFGENTPNQDLHITTGHPVYFNDEFYLPENFIGKKNIKLISKDAVYVYHLQFDTHEVVYSNNFTTTSLPPNTDYQNLHLKEEEFIDKTKYNKENIGKMYPPYMLHEEPLLIQEIDL